MNRAILSFLLFFASNILFGSELNLVYTPKEERGEVKKSCRQSHLGCTVEQELALAQEQGVILTPSQLNNYLAQNSDKSYFIPLELSDNELLLLAASTSLGIIAFHNDQEIMDTIQKNKTKVTESISSVGNFLGSTAVVPLSAGSYFLSVYYKNNQLKKVALFTVGASMAQSLVTLAVKKVAGRARPNNNEGPNSFFNKHGDDQSFYSGHTSEAFTLATVISEIYKKDYPIVPWVAYGLASVTAYARVHDQQHWASDVIIGAVAGHLITKLALDAMNFKSSLRG